MVSAGKCEEGNGKSTLLKLLYSEETVGNYVHHTGEIIRDGILAYLPQFMGENDQLLTVAEYLADTDFYDDYNIINNVNHLRGIRSCFSYCDRTSYHEVQMV